MNFGAYPQERDIIPEDRSVAARVRGGEREAIKQALVRAEELLGHPLMLVLKKFKMEIKESGSQAPEYPICNVKMFPEVGDVVDRNLYTVDEDKGIIFGKLPESYYYVYTEVGFREGKLPATVQFLLKSLASYYLTGNQEDKDEAETLSKVWIGIRARIQEQRNELTKTS